nr:hypothetical protein BgiMline_010081 [Biomphalaria glabrata]
MWNCSKQKFSHPCQNRLEHKHCFAAREKIADVTWLLMSTLKSAINIFKTSIMDSIEGLHTIKEYSKICR